MPLLEPSLLSFDLTKLDQQLDEVKNAGALFIHYDVMDGIFVANKAFLTNELAVIQKHGLKANVHMMVKDVKGWINKFLSHPMNACVFHPEACDKQTALECFELLKKQNVKFGIALKPYTNIQEYNWALSIAQYVCIMGVEPGKGGQLFIESVMENIKYIHDFKIHNNPNMIIQLDGGVNTDIIKRTHGLIDNYVSGSFLMKQENKKQIFDLVK